MTWAKREREETRAQMARLEPKAPKVPREVRDPGARLGHWVRSETRERSELQDLPATQAALEKRERKDHRERMVPPDPREKEDEMGCRAPWVPPAPGVLGDGVEERVARASRVPRVTRASPGPRVPSA